ncbi:MAG TPA: c-type cytochrome [Bryobacteraceae bacterium]|nr:c-type cytochrome [Bryobacteraceae bacterium]
MTGKYNRILAVTAGMVVYLVLTLAASVKAQTADAGKELFQKRCGGCHALDRDKEGPRLHGVYGRTAGSIESFQYSDALRKSNVVWSEETLERWLADTESLVPGNDMTFHVEKAGERGAIIAFLKQDSHK